MHALTKKGQVTIPKPMRERLGLEEGDYVEFLPGDGEIILRKRKRRGILGLGALGRRGAGGKGVPRPDEGYDGGG